MTIAWTGAHANNFQKGRLGSKVTKIVCHWIVGKLAAADATFQDPKRIASAHYGIGNTVVHQYVKEEDTAYHAGNLTMNRQSIGIEHEGGPSIPISELTYKTSATLIADISRKYAIPLDRVHIIKHSEVKATQCPGTLDIDKLIAMAAAIVAPVVNNDLQKELDKVRAERDSHWNDLQTVKNDLSIVGEYSLEIIRKRIETLLEEEREYGRKEQDLQSANITIASLETELSQVKADNTTHLAQASVLTSKVALYEKTVTDSTKKINDLMTQLAELKNTMSIDKLEWWEHIKAGIKKFIGMR